jgi:hypothetical protein
LVAIAFTSNAQTFEETVSYINEKLKCCSVNYSDANYKTISMTAEHNGIITYKCSNGEGDDKIDILSLFLEVGMSPIFVQEDLVKFRLTRNRYKLWRFVSSQEAERVVKAIIHLKSLCKKENELFDK